MAEPLRPEGKLDVSAVAGFHAELVARMGQDIVIDFEKVTQIGALCAQTCLAAARAAQSVQSRFELINLTDPLLAQLGSMGLTPQALSEGRT